MESRHEFVSQSSEVSNEESKWQYVGNGLWENGDRQTSQEPAKSPTVTTPSTPSFLEKKKQVDTLNLATSYHGQFNTWISGWASKIKSNFVHWSKTHLKCSYLLLTKIINKATKFWLSKSFSVSKINRILFIPFFFWILV